MSAGRRPLRVLVSGIVLDQPMGGVRRHNAELLGRLGNLLAGDGGGLALLVGRGGVAFPVPAPVESIPCAVPSRPTLVRAALETAALARVVREAREAGRPFDLVHTGHLPAPRHLPLPLTITIHDLRSLDLPHTPFSRRMVARGVVGRAIEGAVRVFTVSESMARRLRAGWPGVAGRLSVVPNAADHLEPLPRRPGPGAPLLHLGHLEPRKNLELLVRALAVDPGLPDLLLAGAAKGDEGRRLAALAAELGVAGRLRFRGPVDDGELAELYATCAAVVLPSRLEGFGIVALEALRARAPLAISTAGALPEVAGEGVPSFSPDDAAQCAQAVHRALEAGDQALAAGAERADRYRWGDAAEAWRDGLLQAHGASN